MTNTNYGKFKGIPITNQNQNTIGVQNQIPVNSYQKTGTQTAIGQTGLQNTGQYLPKLGGGTNMVNG